jgi:5'-nucleotidase
MTVQPVAPPAAYGDDCADAPSGGNVYGVCLGAAPCSGTSPTASPSDTALVALERFVPDNFWPDGPDLVLSGTNFGQNAGEAVNHSGTVGAAITAHELGAPVIAFSAEVDFTCAPNPFACVPFADTGTFAVDLIGRLAARELLDSGLALNVNYPVVRTDETLGRPVYAVVGTGTNIAFAYDGIVGEDGGTYSLVLGAPVPELRETADTTALNRNDIPITPLDGDWTADAAATRIRGFLEAAY